MRQFSDPKTDKRLCKDRPQVSPRGGFLCKKLVPDAPLVGLFAKEQSKEFAAVLHRCEQNPNTEGAILETCIKTLVSAQGAKVT